MTDVVQQVHTRVITIRVNNKPVDFTDEHGRAEATGQAIKAAAIAQGVNIRPDFALFRHQGQQDIPVRDDETVHVHENEEFRAVAPDDNS